MRWVGLVVVLLAGCPDRSPEAGDGVPCGEAGRCTGEQVCCVNLETRSSACSTVADCPHWPDDSAYVKVPQACDGPEDCGGDPCCGGSLHLDSYVTIYDTQCFSTECEVGFGGDGSPHGRMCHDAGDCLPGANCCPCWGLSVCVDAPCDDYCWHPDPAF